MGLGPERQSRHLDDGYGRRQSGNGGQGHWRIVPSTFPGRKMDCIHGHRFGALDNSVESGVRGRAAIELNDRLWQRPVISPDGKWIAGFYADHQLSTQNFRRVSRSSGSMADHREKCFLSPSRFHYRQASAGTRTAAN